MKVAEQYFPLVFKILENENELWKCSWMLILSVVESEKGQEKLKKLVYLHRITTLQHVSASSYGSLKTMRPV